MKNEKQYLYSKYIIFIYLQKNMEIVKRSIFGIIFLSILSYLVFLIFTWVVVVLPEYSKLNISILIFYIIIFLYYLFFYIIKPSYVKKHKLRNTLIGIFLITSSQSYLLNAGHLNTYFADIFTVIGVFLTIIWPTNLLISKKIKQKNQEKKMEVIEV